MPPRVAGVTDYSKWDRLDDSDDEKHSHPNIDIGLQRRIQRELRDRKHNEDDEKLKEIDEAVARDKARLDEIRAAIKDGSGDAAAFKEEKEMLESRIKKRKEKADYIKGHEQLYVNGTTGETNMYKEVFNSGHVNADRSGHKDGFVLPPPDAADADYARGKREDDGMQFFEFGEKYDSLLKEFCLLGQGDIADTREFLVQNAAVLLQEHALAWTKFKALEFEMAGKRKEMLWACRQSEVLYAIAELSKQHNRHPGNIIGPFIEGLKDGAKFAAFREGVNHFAKQISERAVAKKQEQELGLQPGQDPYAVGALVEAQGLKGAAELNGLRGRICGKQGERLGVLFPEPHGKKALKKDNLKLIQVVQQQQQQEEEEEETELRPPRPEDCTDPDKLWWLPYGIPREDRLGPGGEDPCEVFKLLPEPMKAAFRTREIEPLKEAVSAMSEEDARKYLGMCTAAGLWNPGGGEEEEDAPQAAGP